MNVKEKKVPVTNLSTCETAPVFQLKGGLYTLTALQLLSNNLTTFEKQLENKIHQAPKFFFHAPVVIDLQRFNSKLSLDFSQLKTILISKNLIPVGVKGGSVLLHESAIAVGLPILNESAKEKNLYSETSEANAHNTDQAGINKKPKADVAGIAVSHATNDQPASKTQDIEIRGSNTRVITDPVRSGQQIYARGGDLLVLAPVSHGSELLADGHIHIYGPLRGRALAGITGDTHARIFCHSLEAELISIAGQYKISEDIEQTAWKQAVEISLIENRLHIKPF